MHLWYHLGMSTTIDMTAFNRGTDPILQFFTVDQAREIVEYRGDSGLQQRVEELAERANEGMLTPDEQAEYEGYVRANKFVAILQAKARKLLSNSES
jgi:selenocysteine lyase/cysteine desulfurase